ncbi:hydrolase [Streptomyces avidinii]
MKPPSPGSTAPGPTAPGSPVRDSVTAGQALRAVLFDMDGTLVDTEPLWWQATEAVAESLGHTLAEADVAAVVGRSVTDTAEHLHRTTGGRVPVPSIERSLLDGFHERVARGPRAMPGALDLLDALAEAGIPLGLVSASPRSVVDLVLAGLGPHRFAVTFADGETPRTKPHPDPYLAAAKALGVEARSCVAVEDSPAGIASAEAAGCHVLAVPSSVPIDAADGRTVVAGLTEVDPALLRALGGRRVPGGRASR